jgi:hypothetical protein
MKMIENPCKAEWCEKMAFSKYMCKAHYEQNRKYGKILTIEEAAEKRRKEKGVRLNSGKTLFKKGMTPWNKGMKGAIKGHGKGFKKGMTPWNKGKKLPHMSGESNPNWKGGISSADKLERTRFRKTLQKIILQRDDYTCQICLVRGGNLQIDHIKRWSEYPELRFDMNNCRTACMACHYYVTFKRKLPEGVIWGHNLNRRIAS